MTKKELVKIIREVVRREIKKEINEIFINEQKTSKTQLTTKMTDLLKKLNTPKKMLSNKVKTI